MSSGRGGATTATSVAAPRLALVGSPNSGKTTLFNALTGLRAKTGNYPGVTVARYEGSATVAGRQVVVEDLPGTYSLDPISLDEQIVTDLLDPARAQAGSPDGLVVTLDATTLRRSLGLLAQVLHTGLPVCVVLTFTDELARRQGALDVGALRRAVGVPVVSVVAGRQRDLTGLRELLSDPRGWPGPPVLPPTATNEMSSWITSVLAAAGYEVPQVDRRTRAIDAVLLHPLWGTLVFFVTMFAFFQVVFTVAAPLQTAVEDAFGSLGGLVDERVPNGVLASFLSDALIGGVGGVLVFLPQIALLFLLVSLLEGVGYMARAAFLMDRVMSKAGLEGRAFVALLSSLAVRGPRHHGHPHPAVVARPHRHDAGCAAHDVLGAAAGVRAADRAARPSRHETRPGRGAGPGHVRALPARRPVRDDGRVGLLAHRSGRRTAAAVLHGDAPVPGAVGPLGAARGLGRLPDVPPEGRQDHPRHHDRAVAAAQPARPGSRRAAVRGGRPRRRRRGVLLRPRPQLRAPPPGASSSRSSSRWASTGASTSACWPPCRPARCSSRPWGRSRPPRTRRTRPGCCRP